jgi:hypothetical protein
MVGDRLRGARAARVLVVSRGGRARRGAVLVLPRSAAVPARRALPALRAAGAMRVALPGGGIGAGARVDAGGLRRSGPRARACAEVPGRAGRRRRHGRAGGGRRAGRAAGAAGGARAGPDPPGAAAPARVRSRRCPRGRHRQARKAAGGALPGPRRPVDTPGRGLARGAACGGPGGGAAVLRAARGGGARRRRLYDRGDARGVCTGACPRRSRRRVGRCLCAGVENRRWQA